jgi:hypothetical protein
VPGEFFSQNGFDYYDFLREFGQRKNRQFPTFNTFFTDSEEILINYMFVKDGFVLRIRSIVKEFLEKNLEGNFCVESIQLYVHSGLDICTMCSRKIAAMCRHMNSESQSDVKKNLFNSFERIVCERNIPFLCVTSSSSPYNCRRNNAGIDSFYNSDLHKDVTVNSYAKSGYYVQTLIGCQYNVDPQFDSISLLDVTFRPPPPSDDFCDESSALDNDRVETTKLPSDGGKSFWARFKK